MLKKHKLIFSLLVVSTVIVASLPLHAVDNYPYFDPKKDGYNIKDDESPWFDGKKYPFFQDMFDGKSIKPQEEGTYQKFPEDSVPVRMVLGKLVRIYDPFIPAIAGDGSGPEGHPREFWPKNPTQATPESIYRGKILYNTYCAACHGEDGLANTIVVKKGVPAPERVIDTAPLLSSKTTVSLVLTSSPASSLGLGNFVRIEPNISG